MKDKIVQILKTVFSVGTAACMLLALLLVIAFIVAFAIGGDTSSAICAFIRNYAVKGMCYICSALAIIGVAKTYICKERVYTMDIKKKKI